MRSLDQDKEILLACLDLLAYAWWHIAKDRLSFKNELSKDYNKLYTCITKWFGPSSCEYRLAEEEKGGTTNYVAEETGYPAKITEHEESVLEFCLSNIASIWWMNENKEDKEFMKHIIKLYHELYYLILDCSGDIRIEFDESKLPKEFMPKDFLMSGYGLMPLNTWQTDQELITWFKEFEAQRDKKNG